MLKLFQINNTTVVFLIFLVAVSTCLNAQTKYINFRHYSLQDGLSSYKVVKVLEDRYGFIWIATQDGLNRFDGKSMVIYNKSSLERHRLAGNDITDILEDSIRNILWVTTSFGGLNGIDLKTGIVVTNFSVWQNNFSHPWLKSIIQNNEDLLIGSFDGITIYDIKEKKFRTSIKIPFDKKKNNNKEYDINIFFKDEFGRIWIFIADYGLLIYSKKGYKLISLHSLQELNITDRYVYKRFNGCGKIENGKLLLAANNGITIIKYDATNKIKILSGIIESYDNKEIKTLTIDKKNNIWFSTNDGLYFRKVNDSLFFIKDINDENKKKWIRSVNSIYFDDNNQIWLGTLQGLMLGNIFKNPFLSFSQSADLKTAINRTNFIFPFNDNIQYACADDGLYEIDNSNGIIRKIKEGLFWSMFRNYDGNLILSGLKQLLVFIPPNQFINIENVYPELRSISMEMFNSFVLWQDSLAFWGSEEYNGVYKWNFKRKTLLDINSSLSKPLMSGIINTIYKDEKDRLWILSDSNFTVYSPLTNSLKNFSFKNPLTNESFTFYFDICEASGSYWMTSYSSGIIQIDSSFNFKKLISVKDGLLNAGLYKIFAINDSTLMTTSNNGISQIKIPNLFITNYSKIDGLHSDAFEENCGKVYNNKIYVGGPDGFTIVDPGFLSKNIVSPKLYVSKIFIKAQYSSIDTSNLDIESLSIPNNFTQVTLTFSAINFVAPKKQPSLIK